MLIDMNTTLKKIKIDLKKWCYKVLYRVMPKTPIDYSKTINYKLVCNDLSVKYVYVGHTTSFKERKYKHKSTCNNENSKKYNCKIYQTIRENGGWENWYMIEIEKYPCNDLNEATKRERYWYEELNADMNSNYPNRTQKEYQEQNKDKIREQQKEYQKQNKDKIREQQKEYYEDNKEKMLEYQKEYKINNKDKIREKEKEIINCECGSIITYNNFPRHIKSKKHQTYLSKE